MITPDSPHRPAFQVEAELVENVPLARDTYRIRLTAPEIAENIVPGQFVMLRLPGRSDPLLGRAFALYDTLLDGAGDSVALDIGYLVVGRVTALMTRLRAGDRVVLWGPLGNGFRPAEGEDRIWMVAGGIGQTPFVALARESLGLRQYGQPGRSVKVAREATLVYGVRTRDLLAGVDDFERLGVDVHVSTDDGTAGRRGLVTDLLAARLSAGDRPDRIACCGPEPMMAAVARLAAKHAIPCELSLETPMACGVGACFSCVVRVRDRDDPEDWDYRRVCVEGPVFDASRVML